MTQIVVIHESDQDVDCDSDLEIMSNSGDTDVGFKAEFGAVQQFKWTKT